MECFFRKNKFNDDKLKDKLKDKLEDELKDEKNEKRLNENLQYFVQKTRHALFLNRLENIDTLVFGGGGIKCMGMVTALFSLCEENLQQWFAFLSKIKTIKATSAGCLAGLLCALSVNFHDIDRMVQEIDIAGTLLPEFKSEYFMRMIWGDHLGLLDSNNLLTFYEKILIMLQLNPKITLIELFAKTRVDIEFYACDVLTCKPVSFSYKSHPELSVARAMAASSCIPFLFTMVEIEKRKFIDGGVMVNVPVQGNEDPKKTLIFSIENKPETGIHSAVGLGMNLLYMMFASQLQMLDKYQHQVVNINTESISFLEMFTAQQSFQKSIWDQAKVIGKKSASTFDGFYFLMICFLLQAKKI
jgi:predicted acylesterase/phospholipase RssA